jgi:two-component system nitrate/nitrite response regulator NarP
MPEDSYKVMIVDDHPLIIRGLRQLLAANPRFNIVTEVTSGEAALQLAGKQQPDIILLDLHMTGISGLETLQALRSKGINAIIIILTFSDSADEVQALINAGADAYLLKDSTPEELLAQIQRAAAGERVLSEKVQHCVGQHLATSNQLQALTAREMSVLEQVAKGMSNKLIACELDIAEQTVKVHIRSLLKKLNVHSRLAAAVVFMENR